MNARILNRDFKHPDDGWYMIEPHGDHPNKPAKVIQVIDNIAGDEIANRFNEEAAAGILPHGNEMLIDHEHFKHDIDKETRAYGWLTKLQNRNDGLYGQLRWTATGKAAVDGGDYRFFSTEYDPRDTKILNQGATYQKVRPLRLDGLTLTNNPNNRGGKPITNRNGNTLRRGTDAPADEPTEKTRTTMKSVCTRLGLSADASEDAVLAEVQKLLNRATVAEEAITPFKNRTAELESENKSLLATRVESDWARIKNRFKPEEHEDAKKQLIANRDGFLFAAERMPVIGSAAPRSVVLNRGEGKTPGDRASVAAEQVDEQALANKAEAEVQSYKLMNRCTYSEARNAVRMQKPELFGVAPNATN